MARRSCRPSVQKFLEADSLISNWLTSIFTPVLTSEQTSTSTMFSLFHTVSAFRTLFVQWKHHISICYCFDFRCSCRTCHNKKTIQQDFVRIWTDSGVYRDSIIVSSLKSYPNPSWISESLTNDIQELIIYKFCKNM